MLLLITFFNINNLNIYICNLFCNLMIKSATKKSDSKNMPGVGVGKDGFSSLSAHSPTLKSTIP